MIFAAGCSSSTTGGPDALASCSVPLETFVDGGLERSSIPALTNPKVARRGTPDIAYLSLGDRVIGVEFNGQPLAVPHKLLWWHEIVNFQVPGQRITVTYSPLTGSSLVFDRISASVDSFGVSNYVLDTNLVLEDESGTLWPQMSSVAGCGSRDGVALDRLPHQEMTLGAWFAAHPDTWIVSSGTGFDFFYTLYPYGDYEVPDNPELRFPLNGVVDVRRPPKERVFGVPAGSGGIAFPLPVLDAMRGAIDVVVSAANAELEGEPIVVFYNAFAQGAMAFRSEINGLRLTFDVVDGQRVDRETGSAWDFQGGAFAGPMAGAQLERITDAYTSFWFAWAHFQPDTELFAPPAALDIVPRPGGLGLPDGPIDWELSRR